MGLKMAEYPLDLFFFDMSGPSRDLYRSSQISTRRYQNPPSGLLCFHRWSINKIKIKILKQETE